MLRPKVNKNFKIETLKDLPIGTYGQSMQLTETLEAWRNVRPQIDYEKCIKCGWCYFVCPEGVIYKEESIMQIDYNFCKGCGICAKECKKHCINLVREGE